MGHLCQPDLDRYCLIGNIVLNPENHLRQLMENTKIHLQERKPKTHQVSKHRMPFKLSSRGEILDETDPLKTFCTLMQREDNKASRANSNKRYSRVFSRYL